MHDVRSEAMHELVEFDQSSKFDVLFSRQLEQRDVQLYEFIRPKAVCGETDDDGDEQTSIDILHQLIKLSLRPSFFQLANDEAYFNHAAAPWRCDVHVPRHSR